MRLICGREGLWRSADRTSVELGERVRERLCGEGLSPVGGAVGKRG